MDLIKKITLSDNFSAGLFYLSLAAFAYMFYISMPCMSLYKFSSNLFIFLIGALAIYPAIDRAWLDVKRGWDEEVGDTGKTYRDFFAGKVDEETGNKLVKNHWNSIRWVIPYTFGIYLCIALFTAYFFEPNKLFLLFFGSLLMVALDSVKYQRELEI